MKRFLLALLFVLAAASASAQDPSASGTVSATTPCPGVGCVQLLNLSSREMASVRVSGTWSGTLLAQITGSWVSVPVYDAATKASSASITANGTYLVPMQGASSVRVVASAFSSGSASVTISAGTGAASFVLPAGAATEATLSALNAKVTAVNTGATVVASSALPAGASTSALQSSGNSSLSSIDGKTPALVSGRQPVDGSGVTQPVSAAALPLPAGAATAALQTSGNASVASIDTKTPALGQALAAASVPIVLTAVQLSALTPLSTVAVTGAFFPATQPISAAALPLPADAASETTLSLVESRLQIINSNISSTKTSIGNTVDPTSIMSIAGKSVTDNTYYPIPLAGVGTSVPVSGTFFQPTQPVSASALPLPSGASTSALQGTANSSLSSMDTKTPALGQALAVASVPIVLTAAQLSALTPLSTVAVTGTFFQGTQPISAAALPLPAGAATSALQTTGNTAMTGIELATTTLGAGITERVMSAGVFDKDGASMSVMQITNTTPSGSDKALIVRNIPSGTQPVSAAALPLPAGASTSSLQTTGNSSLSSIDGKTPALGQALAGASSPVVLPAAQITALTPPAAISGFALDATLTGGTATTRVTDGTNTATVKAASTPAAASDKALVVAVSPNNTVPISAASLPSHPVTNAGTFAVQCTSGCAAGTPGQTTMSASSPVVIASDQSAVPTTVKQTQPAATSGALTSTTCPGTGCVSLTTTGFGTTTVTIHGTYSLTAAFEFSDDSGTTWYPTTCTRTDTASQDTTTGAIVNQSRAWDCSVYATTNFRVRATTFLSGSGTVNITPSSAAIEAAPTVSVLPPPMTVGTRPSPNVGFTTQSVLDTSRANVSLTFTTTAPTAADTVVTALVKSINATALAGAQSITPSAGNTMRLQSATVHIRTTTAATPWVLVTLRESATGTCSATSSVVAYLAASGTAAVIGNTGTLAQQFPAGWQITEASTHSFCITVSGNVNTNVLTVSIQAFEFSS